MKSKSQIIVLLLIVWAVGCRYQSQKDRDLLADNYLSDADQFIEQGMMDSALAAFNLALEENPRLVEAHKGIGNIYRRRGDYERASRAYKQATIINPADYEAHYFLGLMKQLSGQLL